MAIQALQIPSSNINNLVDQSQWSSLANLGNVYKQAQEDAAKQDALAKLGQGVDADTATLLHSGVPSLAQIGLNMQQNALTRSREDARNAVSDTHWSQQFAIQQAAAKREQEKYEDVQDKEAKARAAFLAGGQPAAPGPVAPDPAFTQGAPAIVPSPGLPAAPVAQGAVPISPNAPGQPAIPLAPGQMPSGAPGQPAVPFAAPQAPVAPSPIDPSQLQATGAMTATAPIANRIVNNLVSGQPAAAAGLTREQLADMMQDPTYKPLATAMLQKMYSPDEFEYKIEDGRVIAINKTRGKATDITPPTASGQPAPTKEERERQSIYDDAIKSGYSKDAANFMKFNKGKPPSENMTPAEIKSFNDFNNTARTADIFVNNLKQLQKLSKNAYEGFGAQTHADVLTGALGDNAPQAALDTQNMVQIAKENASLQLRSTFGSRPAAIELKYLQDLESNPLMPRSQRENIYTRLIDRFSQFRDEDQQRAQAIQEGSLYKKGPGATAAPARAPTPAPTPAQSPSDDLAAAKWARDNPNDPRAQQIMQHLRGQ